MSLKARDHSLDIFKGLLVLLMSYCHVLQFFSDPMLFPMTRSLEDTANLLVFPGFVFAFGWAAELAFFNKPYLKALPRMLLSAGRSLLAFYLSGIAFRVIREGKPFASGTVRRILLWQDVPGWSEFLLAFAGLGLLTLLLYWLAKPARRWPWLMLPLGLGFLMLSLIPYEQVGPPFLRVFLGTNAYASFPVLPFLPYFLLGMLWAQGGKRRVWLALTALLMTALGAWRSFQLGQLPQRFPPDYGWLLLPAAGLALLLGLSLLLDRLRIPKLPQLQPQRLLSALGRNSLYYLLAGNLTIFALAGRGVAPQLKFKAWGLFGLPIASPKGALAWTVTMLLAAAFLASLVRGRPRPPKPEEQKPS